MLVHKAQSSAATKINVPSSGAVLLFDAMNTAGSTTLIRAGYPSEVNGLFLKVENGDIRYLDDGNTPTATEGMLATAGEFLFLPHHNLDQFRMIGVSTDVTCGVRIGECTREESASVSVGGTADMSDILSTTATYDSVSMSTADTEYTYTLASAAKSIEMRLDIDSSSDFKLNIGGSVGASATDYIPVEDGELYWRQNLNLASGTVLRFQSPSASQTMRIVTYA